MENILEEGLVSVKVKKKFLKFLRTSFLIALAIVSLVFVYFVTHITTNNISVSSFTLSTNGESTIRIVQLTDLHNSQFGKKNSDLTKLVKEQHPDIIVMTGDMLNCDEEDTIVVTELIQSLALIAPVYYGYGNHEYTWMEKRAKYLRQILTDAGAIVVDNNYIDVDLNGNQLRIGGYMAYYRIPGMYKHTAEEEQAEYAFFDAFEDTDRFKILLNHIPTQWVDWGYTQHPVDLVFSGHYHGGQWVLPGIGGVYVPYIGFNPPFTKGIFEGEYATCVLSSGLGNEYDYLPRINNPPEIVVVDLVPNKRGANNE